MSYVVVSITLREDDRGVGNWTRPIDIARGISLQVEAQDWNFNRYDGRVNLRFDIKDTETEELREVADNLVSREGIEEYETESWSELGFVELAHSISTECAVRFREESGSRSELSNVMSAESLIDLVQSNDQHKLFSTLYCFLHFLLQELDFRHAIIWDYQRQSLIEPEVMEEVAESCVTEGMRERVNEIEDRDMPSFCQRFVHLFINCIGWQKAGLRASGGETQTINIEANVRSRLLQSVFWNQLASTFEEGE